MKIGKIKFSICTFQFAISNIITHHGGTGATRQWTPRVKGRLASMDAIASMDVSRQWTPSPVLVTNNMDYFTRSLGKGQR